MNPTEPPARSTHPPRDSYRLAGQSLEAVGWIWTGGFLLWGLALLVASSGSGLTALGGGLAGVFGGLAFVPGALGVSLILTGRRIVRGSHSYGLVVIPALWVLVILRVTLGQMWSLPPGSPVLGPGIVERDAALFWAVALGGPLTALMAVPLAIVAKHTVLAPLSERGRPRFGRYLWHALYAIPLLWIGATYVAYRRPASEGEAQERRLASELEEPIRERATWALLTQVPYAEETALLESHSPIGGVDMTENKGYLELRRRRPAVLGEIRSWLSACREARRGAALPGCSGQLLRGGLMLLADLGRKTEALEIRAWAESRTAAASEVCAAVRALGTLGESVDPDAIIARLDHRFVGVESCLAILHDVPSADRAARLGMYLSIPPGIDEGAANVELALEILAEWNIPEGNAQLQRLLVASGRLGRDRVWDALGHQGPPVDRNLLREGIRSLSAFGSERERLSRICTLFIRSAASDHGPSLPADFASTPRCEMPAGAARAAALMRARYGDPDSPSDAGAPRSQ